MSSIQDIQHDYFALLGKHLREEQAEFRASGMRPFEFAMALAQRSDANPFLIPSLTGRNLTDLQFKLRDLLVDVQSFWQQNSAAVLEWIAKTQVLCFLCNLPFTPFENIATISRFGLYFDTICITDPLYLPADSWRAQQMHDNPGAHEAIYLVPFFEMLTLEELVATRCDPPIAIVYPAIIHLNIKADEVTEFKARDISRKLVGSLLGLANPPTDDDGFFELCQRIPEGVSEETIKTSPLFDSQSPQEILEWGTAILLEASGGATDLSRIMRSVPRSIQLAFGMSAYFHRQLYNVFHAEHECGILPMSQPFLSRPPWQMMRRALELGGEEERKLTGLSEEEAAVLAFENPGLRWLSNVTTQELIRLRDTGFMDEMRSFFRLNAAALRRSSGEDFENIWKAVQSNMDARLRDHSKEIETDQSAYKHQLRLSAGSLLVTAGLGVASIALPALIPLSIGSAIYSAVIGGKSIKDILQQRAEHGTAAQRLANRPIAFLYDLYSRDIDSK